MVKNDTNKNIAGPLLDWYAENKRDLPWRRTRDLYAILVSEMMLQQTQAGTVIDYYRRFLQRFPTFEALAAADTQDVLSAWQGLGYYSRARNLHKLARRVVTEYGGALPTDAKALKNLPGVGDYVCGAVMSIAFEKPVPAVDGNVLRVVTRLMDMHADVTKAATRKRVAGLVGEWMPPKSAGDFTQAMMELGALVCKPKKPECRLCPLMRACSALEKGTVETLPVKTAKPQPRETAYYVLLVTSENALLMEKREDKGLLAGMWGLPMVEKRPGLDIDAFVQKWLNLPDIHGTLLGETVHTFTHRRWDMTVMQYQLLKRAGNTGGTWFLTGEIADLPVPTAYKRVIRMLRGQKRQKGGEK